MKKNISFLNNFKFYISFFTKYKRQIPWLLLFNLIHPLPGLLFPLLVKIIVDSYIPAADKENIYFFIVLVAAVSILNVIFYTAFQVNYIHIVKNVSRDIRNIIVQKLQTLSLSYLHKQETGRQYSKIMVDVEKTEIFANLFSNTIFGAIFSLAITIAVLSAVNIKILGFFLLILPVFFLVFQLFRRAIRKNQREAREAREDLSATISSFIQTSTLSRMHGEEIFEQAKVDKKSRTLVKRFKNTAANLAFFASLNGTASLIFQITVIAIAAVSVIDGHLTLGEMLLFIQYIQQLMGRLMSIINIFPQVSEFSEAVNSIKEILHSPDIEYNTGKRNITRVKGNISFDRVSFSYDDGQPTARDVSVDIPAGMTVGLVGKSGAGKSTFVNLVLGLYRTRLGMIKIDGMPINELNMRSVRRFMSVVSQDPIIFSGTIFDNITHASQTTPFEKVMDAAKKANAHEFIIRLNQGYDTYVGEGGVTLSGGQRQRIALARAILRNPAILILDEATSSLDSESEREVQQAIDNMANQQTTLIIAHRLSTVRNADMIVVFDDGRIVEKGTHEELVALGGEYASLLKYQQVDA